MNDDKKYYGLNMHIYVIAADATYMHLSPKYIFEDAKSCDSVK